MLRNLAIQEHSLDMTLEAPGWDPPIRVITLLDLNPIQDAQKVQ